MQNLRLILLASGLAFVLPISGYGQSISDIENLSPEDRRAYMESMSPDERAAMREKWAVERAALTDEERAAMRAKRQEIQAERRAKWESMSEEERDIVRAKRQEIHAMRREQWESMSDEERAAAREKMGKRKHGGNGDRQRHKGEDSDTPE